MQRYLRECRELGFDTLELSTGFISLPTDDLASAALMLLLLLGPASNPGVKLLGGVEG